MNPTAPNLEPALYRVATDERFIANLYWTWCGEKLDLDAITRELRAPHAAVIRAGLCFRPRTGDQFTSDVQRIAEFAAIDMAALMSFVRAAESLAAFTQSPDGREHERFLAAARDARRTDDDE
jgi:hypothetical protein